MHKVLGTYAQNIGNFITKSLYILHRYISNLLKINMKIIPICIHYNIYI